MANRTTQAMARAALITGAGRRIGSAIALALAHAGYAVVLHAHRSRAEAERLAGEIVGAGGRGTGYAEFALSHPDRLRVVVFDQQRAALDPNMSLARALSPDNPVLRGTAQNPDVYFQGRETVNKFYAVCPDIVQQTMDKFAKISFFPKLRRYDAIKCNVAFYICAKHHFFDIHLVFNKVYQLVILFNSYLILLNS